MGIPLVDSLHEAPSHQLKYEKNFPTFFQKILGFVDPLLCNIILLVWGFKDEQCNSCSGPIKETSI